GSGSPAESTIGKGGCTALFAGGAGVQLHLDIQRQREWGAHGWHFLAAGPGRRLLYHWRLCSGELWKSHGPFGRGDSHQRPGQFVVAAAERLSAGLERPWFGGRLRWLHLVSGASE